MLIHMHLTLIGLPDPVFFGASGFLKTRTLLKTVRYTAIYIVNLVFVRSSLVLLYVVGFHFKTTLRRVAAAALKKLCMCVPFYLGEDLPVPF